MITLKAEEKEVRLVDRPIVGDGGNEFSYLGQYEILNQYVIYIQGNEWWGYDSMMKPRARHRFRAGISMDFRTSRPIGNILFVFRAIPMTPNPMRNCME